MLHNTNNVAETTPVVSSQQQSNTKNTAEPLIDGGGSNPCMWMMPPLSDAHLPISMNASSGGAPLRRVDKVIKESKHSIINSPR